MSIAVGGTVPSVSGPSYQLNNIKETNAMENARQELMTLSQLSDYGKHRFDVEGLVNAVRGEIQANLISQFALGRLFDQFQDGGGVDTVHNVRQGVYASDESKAHLEAKTSGYNQDVANQYRGGSQRYKDINAEQTAQKKQGKLIDPYTGKYLARNEKTDQDHQVALQNIYEDRGRELSGLGTDEAANSDSNLKLTNASINRSMGAKSKAEYAEDLPRKKRIWVKQREAVKNNPDLSDEKRKQQLKNIDNRMAADEEKIKQSYKEARRAYEHQANKTYYTSSKFLKATALNSGKQAGLQGLKSAAGAVVFQASDILFDAIVPVLQGWNEYPSMGSRVEDLQARTKEGFSDLNERIKEIGGTFTAGLGGGFVSALFNTVINTFTSTSKNVARLLNDVARSLWKAIKILTSGDPSIPLSIKIKEAVKLVSTAVIATGGVILSEQVTLALAETPFSPVADIVGSGVSAIMTGLVTALVLYLFDHMGEVAQDLKNIANTIYDGATLSVQVIKADYQAAIQRIDGLYQEVLESIYDQYDRLNQFAALAFDMNLPGTEQFAASQQFADEIGVEQGRVLRTRDDVQNYFNS